MSQITLRNIPDQIGSSIRSIAKKNNTSINTTIIKLVSQSLGLSEKSEKKRDLSKFAGSWTPSQLATFEKSINRFSKIDKELWN